VNLENEVLQKLRLDWSYNSNAIEGNSFTKGETIVLLMEGMTAKGKPFKDALDIRGHNNAIELMMSIIKEDRDLNVVDLKNLHKILLVEDYLSDALTEEGIKTRKLIKVGEYKSSPNHVLTATGEVHYYATPEETPIKIQELLTWYNKCSKSKKIHPIVLAAVFHHRFVNIHPFDDGNGRMARLVTNLILLKYDYPIAVIKKELKQEYFSRLVQADNGELIPLIEFISIAVNNSLDLYLRAINGEDISDSIDIDMDISLFMQELDLTKERVLERNEELMNNISFELFSFLKSKLDQFKDAFQTTQEILSGRSSKVAISGGQSHWNMVILNQLKSKTEFVKTLNKHLNLTKSIYYRYTLKQDLRRNKSDVYNELGIIFHNKTYVIYYLDLRKTKFYGDKIIDHGFKDLVADIVNITKGEIKEIYKD